MKSNTYASLCQQSEDWRQQADELDFLGEIDLPSEQLDEVLATLSLFRRRFDEPNLAFALAVAAVNWAYWRGVDEAESKSFRESFMTHTMGVADLAEWERVWGPSIEEAICTWSQEPPRSGSYRYVGLILRHAGVPHTKIPRLAQMLKELDRDIGWQDVQFIPDQRIESYITNFFGGCIRDHLVSDAGLTYVRSICSDLADLQSRYPRVAIDLPGYRPGLIPTLLQNLDLGPQTKMAPSFQLPFIRLEFSSGSLEIVFDEKLIRRNPSIQCDQWGKRLFDATLSVGPGGVNPAKHYSGRMPDGRPWTVKGWLYTDTSAWALFRTDGRFATSHSHTEPIPPGDYVLALATDLPIQQLWPDAVNDGERYLPNGTELRLWNVRIHDGDDAKLPNLHVTEATHPWVECANASTLTKWTTLDAVCAESPCIRVHCWTARNKRRFRLTVTTNAQICNVDLAASDDGPVSLFLSDVPIGAETELSLIPVGFQHTPRTSQTLRLVRFPGSISVDHGIWPLDKEATFNITVSPDLELEAEDGATIEVQGQYLKVVVPRQRKGLALRAKAGGASILLRLPVRRSSFSLSEYPDSTVLFDKASVRNMCIADARWHSFTVTAIPGRLATILVKNRHGLARCWRQELRLGSNGRLDLPATELIDVIRNESGILEVFLQCDGHEVSTGSFFVEPICDDLDFLQWPTCINSYVQLLRHPLAMGESLPEQPIGSCLFPHILTIHAVDRELELSHSVRDFPRLPVATSEWLSRWSSLISSRPNSPGSAAADWKSDLRTWLTSAPVRTRPARWNAFVEAVIAEFERKVDIRGPLANLLKGNSDSSVPDGVIHGWQCYIQAESTAGRADQLIRANNYLVTASRGEPPWAAVAKRLSAWTFLRGGAIEAFLSAVGAIPPSDGCGELDGHIHSLASILKMQPPSGNDFTALGFGLSPRRDDQLLAKALGGQADAWRAAATVDWLAAWLAWRWAVIMGADEITIAEFRHIALRFDGAMPSRAEPMVLAELQSGIPHPLGNRTESS